MFNNKFLKYYDYSKINIIKIFSNYIFWFDLTKESQFKEGFYE